MTSDCTSFPITRRKSPVPASWEGSRPALAAVALPCAPDAKIASVSVTQTNQTMTTSNNFIDNDDERPWARSEVIALRVMHVVSALVAGFMAFTVTASILDVTAGAWRGKHGTSPRPLYVRVSDKVNRLLPRVAVR
jgi:hypothetical protein